MDVMMGMGTDLPAVPRSATLADIPQLSELLTLLFTQEADFRPDPEKQCAGLQRIIADPGIGAVAGNAKVGNRVNLVTRWQAVEYVTAQNIERRALARLEGREDDRLRPGHELTEDPDVRLSTRGGAAWKPERGLPGLP